MPNDPVRACHVIHSLQRGGAEHVLLDLARVAPDAGIDLSVVALVPFPADGYATALAGLGVPVASLELPTRWDPRGLGRGLATIRSLRPDVVHTHLKHADLVGAYASRHLGVPMVSTLHLIEETTSPVGRAKRWLAAQARMRQASCTICVSDAQRDWYLRTFAADPTTVVTIRNGIVAPAPLGATTREAIRAELGLAPGRLMATMVGLMRPGKGHRQLLEAACRLPRDVAEQLTIVLAGDGELRPALQDLAAQRGLGPGRLVFAGFRDDVAALLAASDFVAHPTLADALPTALVYALATGRPSVASDVGGVPEVVTPECGLLVPPGDIDALVAAISTLAVDTPLRERLGTAGRARFDLMYDAPSWAGRLHQLYARVAATASPRRYPAQR